jgi:hypothetical protein
MIIWYRRGENHDEKFMFDEILDHTTQIYAHANMALEAMF